jgi:hypothetical protein
MGSVKKLKPLWDMWDGSVKSQRKWPKARGNAERQIQINSDKNLTVMKSHM